jgi:hypothetical protein
LRSTSRHGRCRAVIGGRTRNMPGFDDPQPGGFTIGALTT